MLCTKAPRKVVWQMLVPEKSVDVENLPVYVYLFHQGYSMHIQLPQMVISFRIMNHDDMYNCKKVGNRSYRLELDSMFNWLHEPNLKYTTLYNHQVLLSQTISDQFWLHVLINMDNEVYNGRKIPAMYYGGNWRKGCNWGNWLFTILLSSETIQKTISNLHTLLREHPIATKEKGRKGFEH